VKAGCERSIAQPSAQLKRSQPMRTRSTTRPKGQPALPIRASGIRHIGGAVWLPGPLDIAITDGINRLKGVPGAWPLLQLEADGV
jgi:hypothetical protein